MVCAPRPENHPDSAVTQFLPLSPRQHLQHDCSIGLTATTTSFDKFNFFVQLHVTIHRGAINTATPFGLSVQLPSAFICNYASIMTATLFIIFFLHLSAKTAPLIIGFRIMAAEDEELLWSILRIPGSSQGVQPVHLSGNLHSYIQRAPSTRDPSIYSADLVATKGRSSIG